MAKTKILTDGTQYFFYEKHRDGTPEKSQWRINYESEFIVFESMCRSKWVIERTGWGFYFIDQKIEYLGVAQDHVTRVFIAKFVRDPNQNLWHGYPADHTANPLHVPDDEIRERWIADGILPEAKIRKIGRSQPCKL